MLIMILVNMLTAILRQKPPRPRSHLPPPENGVPPFACSSSRDLLSCLRALFEHQDPLWGMLTVYIPLVRNRNIFLRASLVLLLRSALERVPRRVLAREHPHGGEACCWSFLVWRRLVGRLVRWLSPGCFPLAFKSSISLVGLPLVGLPLGGTSGRPRY